MISGASNVIDRARSTDDTDCCKFIGSFKTVAECQTGIESSSKGPFSSFTYYPASYPWPWGSQCFGIVDGSWQTQEQIGAITGRNITQNTWVTQLDDATAALVGEVPGLRLTGGGRGIRAKWPNGSPELSGQWYYTSDPAMGHGAYANGWITGKTTWSPPHPLTEATDVVVDATDWPSVQLLHTTTCYLLFLDYFMCRCWSPWRSILRLNLPLTDLLFVYISIVAC